MNLIKKATWLDMCRCGDHARFVLPDDTKGTEFFSKDGARRELRHLHGERLIDEAEVKFLSDAVNSCRLPISDRVADIAAVLNSVLLNDHRSRQKEKHFTGYVM